MNTENTNAHQAAPQTEAVQVQGPSKRALADVLWEAANVHLWSGDTSEPFDNNASLASTRAPRREYSCDAVGQCANSWPPAWKFVLSHLGCPTGSDVQFRQFSHGMERQGVRYMWLLLAMHVAEDEGLTC